VCHGRVVAVVSLAAVATKRPPARNRCCCCCCDTDCQTRCCVVVIETRGAWRTCVCVCVCVLVTVSSLCPLRRVVTAACDALTLCRGTNGFASLISPAASTSGVAIATAPPPAAPAGQRVGPAAAQDAEVR
jgi:hypothetical protein